MINKKLGNDFEQELCEVLADEGFWVHNFANRKNGQPADIIAVKNHRAFLIDAKVCTLGVFTFSRVEENQRYAMDAWILSGNIDPYFAVKCKDEIYMVSYVTITDLERRGKKQLNKEDMEKYGTRLATWLRIRGN